MIAQCLLLRWQTHSKSWVNIMNKKILDIINTTAGQLIFALLSGLGYFMLISGWVIDFSKGSWLILMYIAPLVICGAAIVIIKLIKQSREAENVKTILKIFWLHVVVLLLGIVFTIANFT